MPARGHRRGRGRHDGQVRLAALVGSRAFYSFVPVSLSRTSDACAIVRKRELLSLFALTDVPGTANGDTVPLTPLLEVDTPWMPTYLSLCLDRLAYASSQELQVIRIDLRRHSARPSTMVRPRTSTNPAPRTCGRNNTKGS